MKRLISIVMVLLLLVSVSSADEIDLSTLSFNELRELKTKISIELTKRPEWKEVSVPAGLYQVGVDIPAGEWCLKCGENTDVHVSVTYGKKLNESKSEVVAPFEWVGHIYQKSNGSTIDFLNIKMINGYYLEIKYGSVLFCTPEKVTLGF